MAVTQDEIRRRYENVRAALGGPAGSGNVVCIVSGGNIDTPKLVKILAGEIP